jgi:hypothetical protein
VQAYTTSPSCKATHERLTPIFSRIVGERTVREFDQWVAQA